MIKDQSAKADAGKGDPSLLQKDMAPALYLVQRVLDYGLIKYSRGSWQKVEWDRWDAAQRRHQQAIDLGEELDEESGLPHRAHIIAGQIIMLMHEHGLEGTVPIKELGQFNTPPQDHKKPDTSEKRHSYVRVADARIGDRVLYSYEPVCSKPTWIELGKAYKVKEVGRGQVLVKADNGFTYWYNNALFWGSKP